MTSDSKLEYATSATLPSFGREQRPSKPAVERATAFSLQSPYGPSYPPKNTLTLPRPSDINKTTTLTLARKDQSLLRGTSSAVLLEGFGQRLRESAGGCAGDVAAGDESGDAEYEKSFEVSRLDVFFSHSWHACWWLKYFTVLIHFNLRAALCATLMLYWLLLLHVRDVRRTGKGAKRCPLRWRHMYRNESASWFVDWLEPSCLVFFVVVLLSWHHVAAWFCRRGSVFLDKVCIHQTRNDLKQSGIKLIGAFLARSKCMLLVWDETYFTRLWCTYEVSAFRKVNPRGRIYILPAKLGGFFVAYFLLGVADLVFRTIRRFHKKDPITGILQDACTVFASTLSLKFLRNYSCTIKKIHEQIEDFSVHSAACFCCTNNHIHPKTGAIMKCDRRVVYASIRKWYGRDTQQCGLEAFDTLVRTSMREDVNKSLGVWVPVPYVMVLGMYLPLFLSDVSRNGSPLTSPGCHWTDALLPKLGALLVSSPLVFLIECIISCIGRQIVEWRIDWLFTAFLAQVCNVVLLFIVNPGILWSLLAEEEQGPGSKGGRRDARTQGAPSASTWLVKGCVVVYFYFGDRIWELIQRQRIRRTGNDLTGVELTIIQESSLDRSSLDSSGTADSEALEGS